METKPTFKKTRPFNYAIGMFGTSIPINMFRTFALLFYVTNMGLRMDQFAFVTAVYTFVDAIDNVLYGYLSDRTRTRWGRRRPWLVIGTAAFCICFVIFYSPQVFHLDLPENETGLFIFFLIFYVLTGTLDSLINANYGALFPDLFRTDEERAKTNAMRQAFQFLAMIIGIAGTPIIVSAIGTSKTALIYSLLACIVILWMTFHSHENPSHMDMEKPQLFESLRLLFRNKRFWIAGITNAFYSAGMGLVLAALPLYAKYTLGLSSIQESALFASVLVVSIALVAFWASRVKKHTAIPVWRAALLVFAVTFIPFYFANSFVTALIAVAIMGFGLAGVVTTMDLIAAKIIDVDANETGVRREGIYASAGGFLNRLNGLINALAFLLAQQIFGYVSGDEPGPNPGGAARFLLIVMPFLFIVCAVIASRFLNFDEDKNDTVEDKTDSAKM